METIGVQIGQCGIQSGTEIYSKLAGELFDSSNQFQQWKKLGREGFFRENEGGENSIFLTLGNDLKENSVRDLCWWIWNRR
jgi:hypothetical protein